MATTSFQPLPEDLTTINRGPVQPGLHAAPAVAQATVPIPLQALAFELCRYGSNAVPS